MLWRMFNRCGDRAGQLMGLLLLVASGGIGVTAQAECGCYCVDGGLRTLCSTVAEAQAEPELCAAAVATRCPVQLESPPASGYAPPNEVVTNCRDIRVYDPARGSYLNRRACDLR